MTRGHRGNRLREVWPSSLDQTINCTYSTIKVLTYYTKHLIEVSFKKNQDNSPTLLEKVVLYFKNYYTLFYCKPRDLGHVVPLPLRTLDTSYLRAKL